MLLPCRQRLLHAACLASEQARAGSLGGYRDGITYVDTFATMQICQPNINGTPLRSSSLSHRSELCYGRI
jgi:hypothetical protein